MSPEGVRLAQRIGAGKSKKTEFSFLTLGHCIERVRPIRSGGHFGPSDGFPDVGASYLELLRRKAHRKTNRLRHTPPEVDPVGGLVYFPARVPRVYRAHVHAISLTPNRVAWASEPLT
jgi:hypothetical protein